MPIWPRTRPSEDPPLLEPADKGPGGSSATSAGAPLLALEDISAGYRGVPVSHGVSLTVNAGQIALVVGPNGAGKSTLVKSVSGELPLLGGSITFDGTDVSRWDEERRSVCGLGYVPQVRDVFPTLTVVENLEVGSYRLPAQGEGRDPRDARALSPARAAQTPQGSPAERR